MDNNINQNGVPPINGKPIILTRFSEKKRERLSATWASNRVNIPTVFFAIVGEILVIVYAFIIATLLLFGIDVEGNLYFQIAANGVISLLCLGIPVLFMTKLLKTDRHQLYPLRYKRKGGTVYMVMLGLGIAYLGNYITSILSTYLEVLNDYGIPVTPNYGTATNYSLDPVEIALMLITTALIPGIFEELIFRGVYLQGLRKYIGDAGAIFYSALIFGLLHRNIVQAPFAFVVGMILGYICVYTGSLVPGMIIHFINNAISVILTIINCNFSADFTSYLNIAVFIIVLAGSLIGYVCLIKKKPDFLDMPKVISNRTTAKRVLTVIFSPLSVLVILYCLFFIVYLMVVPALLPEAFGVQ